MVIHKKFLFVHICYMNNEEKKDDPATVTDTQKKDEATTKEEVSTDKSIISTSNKYHFKNLDKSTLIRCITIFNIDYAITEEELTSQFKKVNGFERIILLTDPDHPEFRNRGIAYVTYKTIEDAECALKTLNHTLIGNRRIRIEKSYDQETKNKLKHIKKKSSAAQLASGPSDPDFYPSSKSSHSLHQRRSHHSHSIDHERYPDDDGYHHHSYRHHRSHYHDFYEDSPAHFLHPHDSLIVQHHPYPQDYQEVQILAPQDQMYIDQAYLQRDYEPIDKVEDKINELSILVELYRDALLQENIKKKK